MAAEPAPVEAVTTTSQLEAAEYSTEERKQLLRLAHQSIRAALEGKKLHVVSPSEHLAEKRGAFTTLHLGGHLRGCIGFIVATKSLFAVVSETAVAAAFEDPRFSPVTEEEAPLLQIEISVLSPMSPIRPGDVVVGKHGLMITHGSYRGLLLPQVPIEWGWDREQYLRELCHKAGLPEDALQHGAQLEAFTAEVFGEKFPGESLRD
jgi:AmmeMemoRadiSam system protein A